MELCNATVRLAGDLGNTVAVRNATPMQLVLLEAINGEGSIVDPKVVGAVKGVTGAAEKARLLAKYRTKDARKLIEQMLPGVKPEVPETLAEINLGQPPEENELPEVSSVNLVPDAAPATPADTGDDLLE